MIVFSKITGKAHLQQVDLEMIIYKSTITIQNTLISTLYKNDNF